MKRVQFYLWLTMALVSLSSANCWSQDSAGVGNSSGASPTAQVPRLMRFSGAIKDVSGKPLSGVAGVTFALYKDQEGGAALWLETQNVQLDAAGHYSVQLGASKPDGLPAELFASGEARWLGVQCDGQTEQPRVLLLSVPYALKAADAETVGGLPASAFVLANPQAGGGAKASKSGDNLVPAKSPIVHGSGTLNVLPLWTGTSLIGNSAVTQSGSNVGIGTTSPSSTLDVNGTGHFSGLITFAAGQTFPGAGTITGITPGPGLVGGGTSGNVSLGLPITCPNLSVLQWTGSTWACSSAGSGTISGVTAGADLTGGGTSGNVTLNLDTTKVPQLNAANNFTGNQTVNGHLTMVGTSADQLLNVVQKGSGTAIFGFAAGTTGVNFGVSGSSSSSLGVGVSGEGGTGVSGIGFNIGGMFTSNTWILQGANGSGQVQFLVDGSGNIATNGHVAATGNTMTALLGDPGCGAGYAGVGFGALSGCTNYSMIGNGKETFFNRPTGGYIHFRENNGGDNGAGDQMVIAPGGAVGVGTSSPSAQLDVRGSGGTSGFGIAADHSAWQARTAGGWVKAMAYVDPFVRGGIAITRCYNSQASGAAVSTPPCGIGITHVNLGTNVLDFGFEVDDRFVMLTVMNTVGNTNSVGAETCDATTCHSITSGNQVGVMSFYTPGQNPINSYNPTDTPFVILVF
jgi:hypothetical protein